MDAQVGPRCRPQHPPSRSQIPTSSQNRRRSNNSNVLIDQAEGGCARAWPNRVQADRGHGPAECNSKLGRLAGQAVELIVHPPSVHWSTFHLDSQPELGGSLIDPKSRALLTGNPSGLPPEQTCLGDQIAAQGLEAGGPGRWCITLGRGFDLPAAKRHHSSRAWTPKVKGFCLAATCSISTRMTQTKGTPKHPQASFQRRVGRGHVPGGLV